MPQMLMIGRTAVLQNRAKEHALKELVLKNLVILSASLEEAFR